MNKQEREKMIFHVLLVISISITVISLLNLLFEYYKK